MVILLKVVQVCKNKNTPFHETIGFKCYNNKKKGFCANF